ncbi:MAG: hypothetical protein Q4B82_09000 [Alysiella sp.]|uniref:hypothetical protein n=1 Tax=Alysiella sp. TaxID=1872483 RepID=UPI0026DD2255|nr:hypothetical protein [Alysiella sp.]MDO4434698.1 hypothetical protein [Alysiella sp.]
MDFEFGFKTLWGVATAAGWFWVNGLSQRLKEAEQEREKLRERLHDVEKGYQSKSDARELRQEILDNLREIKGSLKEVNEKLDKKADKSCP